MCSQMAKHSLRATTVTILDHAGFANRDIMSVTGHKSESLLKNYARTSHKRKKEMSEIISTSMQEHPSTATSPSESKDNIIDHHGLGLRVGPRPSTNSFSFSTTE